MASLQPLELQFARYWVHHPALYAVTPRTLDETKDGPKLPVCDSAAQALVDQHRAGGGDCPGSTGAGAAALHGVWHDGRLSVFGDWRHGSVAAVASARSRAHGPGAAKSGSPVLAGFFCGDRTGFQPPRLRRHTAQLRWRWQKQSQRQRQRKWPRWRGRFQAGEARPNHAAELQALEGRQAGRGAVARSGRAARRAGR